MPGSAHSQVAWENWRIRSRASTVLTMSPSVRATRCQSSSLTTASMNSSVTRTELLAFWYWIEWLSAPSRSMSNPASRKHAGLAFLGGLAPDELLDIGVIHVEHDHLGRPAGLATGLDGAGRRVGTAHEAHRAGGRAAALERFHARTDPRQVDAGPGAALEDHALFDVPVEDGLHLVLDGEDETGRRLLGDARTPMLNHTGELNAPIWWMIRYLSSSLKTSASAGSK